MTDQVQDHGEQAAECPGDQPFCPRCHSNRVRPCAYPLPNHWRCDHCGWRDLDVFFDGGVQMEPTDIILRVDDQGGITLSIKELTPYEEATGEIVEWLAAMPPVMRRSTTIRRVAEDYDRQHVEWAVGTVEQYLNATGQFSDREPISDLNPYEQDLYDQYMAGESPDLADYKQVLGYCGLARVKQELRASGVPNLGPLAEAMRSLNPAYDRLGLRQIVQSARPQLESEAKVDWDSEGF
jgi:hypothetical protein